MSETAKLNAIEPPRRAASGWLPVFVGQCVAPRAPVATALIVGVLVIGTIAAENLMAEDVVILSSDKAQRSQTRLVGEVLAYNGTHLVIRLTSGIEREFPADQVLDIQPQRSEAHQAADTAMNRHDYQPALAAYRQALARESRRWFRHLLLSKMVQCYRNLGQAGPAGETFLILASDKDGTPYFDRIPLAWVPGEPSPGLAQRARSWLRNDDVPAAVLLGASHLLSTNERPAVLGRLKRLQLHDDPRIAMLARAQSWRAEVATASENDLQQWQRIIESAPEALRGGPYFVLGLAYSQQQEPTTAALALLRVPINYPEDRELAARCLLQAGEALQRIGQNQEAIQLYRELTEDYADRPLASIGAQRLKALQDD